MAGKGITWTLKAFAENVYVNLASGLILLVGASIEIVSTLEEGVIGAHHAVAVYGLLHTLKYLPHLVHGAEEVSKIGD